ncbi:MAG: flagellar protein FliT [Lachnospiraceae bacterium]|nr:flagellar protein FliT [Lachnospiraceae bacterium]
MENQLTILAESLEKKKQVLARIQEYNKRQEEVFSTETVDMDSFDAAVEEKGRLIEELLKLDNGFELLYERLAAQLKDNRAKYASEIKGIQQQIAIVTEMGVAVQVQEKRNKQLIEQYFAKQREGIRDNRKTSKAAYDYYKKLNNAAYNPPQFMDSKK